MGFLPDLSYLQTDLKSDFQALLQAINNLGATMRQQNDTLTAILQQLQKSNPTPMTQPTSQP